MIASYLNVITSEHREQPNFRATVQTLLTPLDDAQLLLDTWNTRFSLDYATGDALDKVGSRIQCARKLTFQPSDGTNATLDDDNYRLIIKAKILKNNWDGTINGLISNFNVLFPNYYVGITDYQDMTMGITIVGLNTTLQKELVENGYILPKPEGVKLNVNFVDDKVFALDLYDSSFAGFDEGEWFI